MGQKTIFSRPDWSDLATRWGTYWTQFLMTLCPTETIELYQEQARKAPNEAAIKANPKAFYYGFGHGADYCFAGQENEYIITKDNVALWKDACVHLLSCSVFKDLGLMFPDGSGYKDTFYFYLQEWPNGVAEQYFRSDHQYFEKIWAGALRGIAQTALKDKFQEYYNENRAGKDYLLWDAACHVITGDPNGRPEPASGIRRITAYYRNGAGQPAVIIGDMKPEGQDVWGLEWKIPIEGTFSLVYEGEDMEGITKRVETGEFTVTFPPSGIHIEPISPKGGEVIVARRVVISVKAYYVVPST